MMALGSTVLHLWIAEFKFTHNFKLCDQLPETELIFGIGIQKKFFIMLCLGQGKKFAIYKEMVTFWFTHTPVIAWQQ